MFGSIRKKLGLIFSLNDPRWGRGPQDEDGKEPRQTGRPNDGPPDLDQLWREFNQRINRLFRGKGGGGAGGGSSNDGDDARNAGISAGVAGAVILFLWLVSGFFIVQEGQTGIVLTFGKYSHSAQPGFNWRWPYPIQTQETVNLSQVRTVEVGYRSNVRNKLARESLMLTDDENIIDIQFAVQYRLKDASAWVFNNRDQEETVKQVAETAIREVVGKSKMDFVLYEGREKVAFDTSTLMQQILDRYATGVLVANVTMQAVQPPEQVQAAFDDAVKAGQDRERQKNEGQAYANDVVPKARGAASRLMQESEGYRARVVANAEGEAARFNKVLVEYQRAPAVMRDRLYIEAMQQIFANKLIAQTAAEAASGVTAPATAATPPAASNEPPLNEGRIDRNRERSLRDRESR
ncbi:MAG: FtsH protease activity modulator HflK [Burkholderiales bacterium]|nr:FtsH protease activity modulator HflK [Burkholderiales bacterium]